jgi:hypothetical protein
MNKVSNIEDILNLMNKTKKRDAITFCKKLTINSTDFANLILVAIAGILDPYKYANHFNDRIPGHLIPSDEERTAMGSNGIGPLRGKAKQAISKFSQMFIDRRYLAAHLFYTLNYKYWHLFYFDQRDNEDHNNHWKEGPHIHYVSDLWTQFKMPDIWNRVLSGDTKFGSTPHIRYLGPGKNIE